ncbi:MAG TPA: glycosyltransferase, partial [Pararhodobacter sp.]|uniref:glycosyltransferase n=1 Tax=Pararhodobacter sp. TaxID=2127056 RepID=UPI002CDB7809
PRFMAEMARSKLAFSPFGYGEVCWRDYESVLAGAVLVKPDMAHVETTPDIFIPWETYAPVAWDLSDFEAVVRRLLADADLREKLARQAFEALHDWLASDAFARGMARVLT